MLRIADTVRSTLALAVLLSAPLTAQIVNGGFEATPPFTGWTLEYTEYRECAYGAWTTVLPGGHPAPALLPPNTLPFLVQTLMVQPYEGVRMARINDPGGLYHATRLRQAFSPTAADIASGVLSVQWGAMLVDGGHDDCHQPGFEIEVTKNGATVLSFAATADDAIADGWQVAGPGLYYKHGNQEIPLPGLLTSDVIQVLLTVHDCDAGGHGAYAFLDAVQFLKCTKAPSAMAGWWHDATAQDLSGPVYNHGAWNLAPPPSTGYVGTSGLMHAGAHYVAVPDQANLDFAAGKSFSIDLWVRLLAPPTGVQPLVCKTQTIAPLWHHQVGYAFYLDNGHPALALASWMYPPPAIETSVTVPVDEWTHLAVTVDRQFGTTTFYFNGAPLGTTFTPISTDLTTLNELRIGRFSDDFAVWQGNGLQVVGNVILNGETDEVELHRRVLSAAEIGRVFGAGTRGKCPRRSRWPFAEVDDLATLRPFQFSHYVGSPVNPPIGYDGPGILFDLTANCQVAIDRIDLALYDEGSAAPDQRGNQGAVEMWVCATTWQGNQQPPIVPVGPGPAGVWRLAGTGRLTVGGAVDQSPVGFDPPIVLPAGAYGVLLRVEPTTAAGNNVNAGPLHPLLALQSSLPDVPLAAGDQFLRIANQNTQSSAFVSSTSVLPRAVNVELSYAPAVDAAFLQGHGGGCRRGPQMFQESFGAAAGFDLQNSAIQLLPVGDTFLVAPSAAAFMVPSGGATVVTAAPPALSSTGLGTPSEWDDALSPSIALPWSFPFPGGATDVIRIGANGVVFLGAALTTSPYYGNLISLTAEVPSLAPGFGDLDPSAGGSIAFEAIADLAVITWSDVPEWGAPGARATFQVVLHRSGIVDFVWLDVALAAAPMLVGFCGGAGVADPGAIDISASAPFHMDQRFPVPVQWADTRPVLGTTTTVTTLDFPPAAPIALHVLGLADFPAPGLDLAPFGLPGCRQRVVPMVVTLALANAGQTSLPLPLPANPALAGLVVWSQAVAASPNGEVVAVSDAVAMVCNVR